MTKRLAELVLLAGFVVMALFLYRSTAAFPQVTQGSTANYIRALAVSLGGLCLLELGLKSRKKEREKQSSPLQVASAPAQFSGLLILMLLYAMLLEPLGFYIASALFLPLSMVLLGGRRLLPIILTSGGVLLFVYVVFARLLNVPLPESTFF